jgi:hypothetical protein
VFDSSFVQVHLSEVTEIYFQHAARKAFIFIIFVVIVQFSGIIIIVKSSSRSINSGLGLHACKSLALFDLYVISGLHDPFVRVICIPLPTLVFSFLPLCASLQFHR